jgi:hypothetical protein
LNEEKNWNQQELDFTSFMPKKQHAGVSTKRSKEGNQQEP